MAVIQHALRITGLSEAAAGLESVGDAAGVAGKQIAGSVAPMHQTSAAAEAASVAVTGMAAAADIAAGGAAGLAPVLNTATDSLDDVTGASKRATEQQKLLATVADISARALSKDEQEIRKLNKAKEALTTRAKELGVSLEEISPALKQIDSEIESVTASSKKAGAAVKGGLADSLDEAGKQAGKLGQGLGILSPTLGALAMGVADAADGLLALATPSGMAIAAVVGLSAAAVGGVAAIAGLVVGLGQATLAADDALASLEGFKLIGSDIYPAVPATTLTSIKEANAAIDALVSVFQLMVVEVGGNVAPAFAKFGKAAVGAGLLALEAFKALTEGQSLLKAVAIGVVSAIQSPFFLLLDLGAALQDTMGGLMRMVGQDVPEAFQNNAQKIAALKQATAEYIVGMIDLGSATSGLSDMYDSLAAKGDTFVQQQMRATAAMEDNKTAAERQAEALEKLAKAWEDYSAAREYDISLGEREAKVMEASRARMEQQAATIQGSFNVGEAIGGAAGQAAAPATMVQQLGTVGNIAGSLQGGAGGLAGAASQIGGAAGMAAAGPIVAAIMQIMQLVTALVPEPGQMGLQDQIHGFFMEFLGDLGGLPAVLAKGMTDSIKEGIPALFEAIPALVEGLIAAIPELIVATVEQFPLMIGGLVQMLIVGIPKAILEGIGALFSADLWKGLADAMVAGFKEIFAPLFGNKATGEKGAFQEGGYFDGVFVGGKERRRGERSTLGSRASGDDFIPQTGLYLMHKGEVVSGNGRLAPATSGGSGGQSIIIQGSVYGIDDLARAMREATRRGVSFG